MKLKSAFNHIYTIPNKTKEFLMEMGKILQFVLLVCAFFITKVLLIPSKIPFLPVKITSHFSKVSLKMYEAISSLSRTEKNSLSRVNLIELAIKNMLFKRSRAIITIGGMMIGIGAIVFLVSIGFGIEKVVTSRVARLEELQQADINTQPGSNQKITDETLAKMKQIPDVEHILPMIASVSRISYNNSETDMPVYGVTKTYLSKSAIQPITGVIYENDAIALQLPTENDGKGSVAGVAQTREVVFNQPFDTTKISTQSWLKVRENPSGSTLLLGFIQPTQDVKVSKVWGASYPDSPAGTAGQGENDTTLGTWYTAAFPIWKKENCHQTQTDCIDGYSRLLDDQGNQVVKTGFVASINVLEDSDRLVLGDSTEDEFIVDDFVLESGSVLGVESASSSAIPGLVLDENGDWTAEATSSAYTHAQQKELPAQASRQAVVNTAFLQVLGIAVENAVGTEFSTSFIIPSNLLPDTDEKIESVPTNYKIVGVVQGDNSPFFYVPFTDLRSLGVTVYSQAKVITKTKQSLAQVRKQIEAMGFASNSVTDTVKQIEQLFGTIRLILITLGLVALAVAALGMFNTLTVSLLERTREVGLMKAMGMKSSEVKELFLTESLIMGMIGGIGGISLGLGVGKLLSIVLSAFALTKGAGTLDISYLPLSFIVFILLLSLFVGITTGLFPARRATKISALNALRYE
ncbi:MAG: ABC transporter permease [bacterium]|nr:ABC transporter permease [bacterium]